MRLFVQERLWRALGPLRQPEAPPPFQLCVVVALCTGPKKNRGGSEHEQLEALVGSLVLYAMLCMLACLFSAMLMVCNSINLLVNPYPNADSIGIYRKGEFSAPS